jgi:hypothetical protein
MYIYIYIYIGYCGWAPDVLAESVKCCGHMIRCVFQCSAPHQMMQCWSYCKCINKVTLVCCRSCLTPATAQFPFSLLRSVWSRSKMPYCETPKWFRENPKLSESPMESKWIRVRPLESMWTRCCARVPQPCNWIQKWMQVSPCQRMSSESTVAHEIQVMPKNESKVRQREPNVIPVAAVCVGGGTSSLSKPIWPNRPVI